MEVPGQQVDRRKLERLCKLQRDYQARKLNREDAVDCRLIDGGSR